jgi:iron complex outermembrane receptor protein
MHVPFAMVRASARAVRSMGHLRTLAVCAATAVTSLRAEEAAPVPAPPAVDGPVAFKNLSLEQLMDVEVTSVSRHAERLSASASAIQVVTGDDIRRSGATSLPEALRLAPNLQVAQVNSSQWAVSARGFDNVLADKLLVMIDGRTVYTPLYGGVFWDVQNVMLEDVDRIEVVSGPGGTLWGANAVNGVINVLSKGAQDTQGLYATARAGTAGSDDGAVRYGGALGTDLFYRVYGERFDRASTELVGGGDAKDDWRMTQGGMRLDWLPGPDQVTVQGDLYDGDPDPDGGNPVVARGGNVLSRWKHPFSPTADIQLQIYGDHTWRDFNNGFTERLDTYDFDWQNRFQLAPGQELTWGLGYRVMDDQETDLALFGFTPAHQVLRLVSGFIQDEIVLVKDRLRLTAGTKLEDNDYTGFEYQPSARVAWTPAETQLLWAAVSRAVRTPSRTDRDFAVSLLPGLVFLQGGADFTSEKLLAYEAGWRTQPEEHLLLSVAAFYNRYDDLRSAEPGGPPFGLPITIGNGVAGDTFGLELAAGLQPLECWRLRGGYTVVRKQLHVKAGSADLNHASSESDDPEQQGLLQSALTLPGGLEFDAVGRYVGALGSPHVASYVGLDLRLAWRPAAHLELAVVGQNLLDSSHPEFVPSSPSPREIRRSGYLSLAVDW